MDIILLLAIFILFYFLGKGADLIVENVRSMSQKLGVNIFNFGLILGILTTLPEISIGVNAITNNVNDISLGNLLGGIVVIFCLILGISLLFERKINTDGKVNNILPIFLLLMLPMFLGLKGKLNYLDGFLLLILYLLSLHHLFLEHKKATRKLSVKFNKNFWQKLIYLPHQAGKEFLYVMIGIVIIIISSNIIIRLTDIILISFGVSQFVIGLLIYAVGTNLPELIVSVRAWLHGVKNLSWSNMVGSAMANILVVGAMAIAKPFKIILDAGYFDLMLFMLIALSLVLVFYKTDKAFTKKEGWVLLAVYALFLASQIILR